ncbi:S-adenosylmethionine:tRNA ribosyltransferase-isomerase [Ktedonosporobacter rubrisoli]|uniref:S-adenosylmethionine:tRNA ribosyltransferase-isomerase n=1 Tax=Ktedonosporobacter rubrisoli TaxID=2509675 RepID=A0A4P6JRY1_KTERU|nr:S-adenosylmethionine:tRNA ribosyltransferase-isomerase [Ktedonosporobacter rubrisoli]QBD78257.1 S-adenosylmethionine:tRNA ribosyltransferase-isomerase [Ktedonosporobacter rubrisoli]
MSKNIPQPPVHNVDDKSSVEASRMHFSLPAELEAGEPPEARGLERDEVRLMVSYVSNNQVAHTRFRQIEDFLNAGDVLVINTSGTLNAALPVQSKDGTRFGLHLSTHLPNNTWVIELRSYTDALKKTTRPYYGAKPGETYQLPAGGKLTIHKAYRSDQAVPRLWIASLDLPAPLHAYLNEYGFPIRYGYVREGWPISYYQTVYATEMGSAEMPSAGRAFTHQLITRLVAKGILIVPLLLHTGVASAEYNEPVYEEYYRVPQSTAYIINAAHEANRRVIAVGTTVVRALETVTDTNGITSAGEGWTDIFITPQRGIHAVNGLITGLHEPLSTHLAMLEAIAGRAHLEITYQQALQEGYLWHEFGDLHLILP